MCIKSEAIQCTATGTGNAPRTALVQTRRRAAALARTHPYLVRKPTGTSEGKRAMESLLPFLVVSSKMVSGREQLDRESQTLVEDRFVEVKQEPVDNGGNASPTHVLDVIKQEEGDFPPPPKPRDAFVDALVGPNHESFRRQGEETEVFMKTLVHALDCKHGCSDTRCTKMRLTLAHFIQCRQIATGATCRLCVQLLSVVSRHSRYLCRAGPGERCPIPMCDSLRAGAA